MTVRPQVEFWGNSLWGTKWAEPSFRKNVMVRNGLAS